MKRRGGPLNGWRTPANARTARPGARGPITTAIPVNGPRPRRELVALGAAAAALVALTLTTLVAVSGAPLPGDIRWARFIQAQSSFDTTANFVNFLGGWNWLPFTVFVLTLAAAARPWHRGLPSAPCREALAGLATVIALRFLDQLLKFLVQSPRPSVADGIRLDRAFSSYGFPSGHVYGDVVFLGAMAVYAPSQLPPRLRLATRLVLIAIIILAGPARVYVGAHWPTDVMGGYLWGAAVLGFAVLVGRGARVRELRLSRPAP